MKGLPGMDDGERRALEIYERLLRDRPEGEFRFRMLERDLKRIGAVNLYDFACPAGEDGLSAADARSADADVLINRAARRAESYPFQAFERSAAERLRFHVEEIIGSPSSRALYDNYLDWHAVHDLIVSELGPKAGQSQVAGARAKLSALLGEEWADLVIQGQKLHAQAAKKEVSSTLKSSASTPARHAAGGAAPTSPAPRVTGAGPASRPPARPAPAPVPAAAGRSPGDAAAGERPTSAPKTARSIGCIILLACLITLPIALPRIISCVDDMLIDRFLTELDSEPASYDIEYSPSTVRGYSDHIGDFGMLEDDVYTSEELGIRIEPNENLELSPFFDVDGSYDFEYWLYDNDGSLVATFSLQKYYTEVDRDYSQNDYVEVQLGSETFWTKSSASAIEGMHEFFKTVDGKTAYIFVSCFDGDEALEAVLDSFEPYE